jgi:predicted nucleic acid-binding protein
MPEIVISDTSSLILLQNMGELDILKKVYKKIVITSEVVEEFTDQLPNWISIRSVEDKTYQQFIETQIDSGEAV